MKNEMKPKERILAAINHQQTDRIPTDYWGTPETTEMLMKALGAKQTIELWRLLEIDKIIGVFPKYKGPLLDAKNDENAFFKCWGVDTRFVKYADGTGEYEEVIRHPLEGFETIQDIEANYVWPEVDWFDFSGIEAECLKYSDYAIIGGYIAPLHMYMNIRGLENCLIDFAAEEEIAFYILDRICDFLYKFHKKLFEAANGNIHLAHLTDDFGTQNGLIISAEMFVKYFNGHYRDFVKLEREYGLKVFHHDDGAIMSLIPELVKIGIDILNPIQWHLPGMDLIKMKELYGKDICFHGGVDNQHVLPFGTVEQVRQEAITCLDILAGDKTGYILAPCHNIQSITPVENIVAMYKTANEYKIV